ncbi:hypothetical protein [Bythopirellula polymerisocia]|uniref:Uncharacterized protein n=1 Tax=Bythopirellula polymerisocia TaxID=2528003 RepID=A0A5C6CE79_9BACT|nr:hypothetical protein [Bythopirellula polymerisocia]TWU22568.1 hypothetical protein Pla144_40280 [Bythopirellula polymerisocia]
MKAAISLGTFGLGVICVALSLIWGLIFPATNQWGPEKAAALSSLSDEVHKLMFQAVAAEENPRSYKGGDPAEVQAEYREKKAKLAEMQQELESIKDSPQTSASYLRWTGIALVVVGAVAVKVLGEG